MYFALIDDKRMEIQPKQQGRTWKNNIPAEGKKEQASRDKFYKNMIGGIYDIKMIGRVILSTNLCLFFIISACGSIKKNRTCNELVITTLYENEYSNGQLVSVTYNVNHHFLYINGDERQEDMDENKIFYFYNDSGLLIRTEKYNTVLNKLSEIVTYTDNIKKIISWYYDGDILSYSKSITNDDGFVLFSEIKDYADNSYAFREMAYDSINRIIAEISIVEYDMIGPFDKYIGENKILHYIYEYDQDTLLTKVLDENNDPYKLMKTITNDSIKEVRTYDTKGLLLDKEIIYKKNGVDSLVIFEDFENNSKYHTRYNEQGKMVNHISMSIAEDRITTETTIIYDKYGNKEKEIGIGYTYDNPDEQMATPPIDTPRAVYDSDSLTKAQLTKQLEGIKTIDRTAATEYNQIAGYLMSFRLWSNLITEGENSEDVETVELAKKFRKEVIKMQRNELPKMRKEFAEIYTNNALEQRMSASVSDTDNTIITFYASVFKEDENIINVFHQRVQETLYNLRFKEARYRSNKDSDVYIHFSMDTLADEVIMGKEQ